MKEERIMRRKIVCGILATVNFYTAYIIANGAPLNRTSTVLLWIAIGMVYVALGFKWLEIGE